MGRFTYYSPLWLGALLVVLLNDPLRGAVPTWAPWQQWLLVIGVALATGVQCQLLLVGAQGAFAQCLPVPGGRTIRGGLALAAGWLLIGWCVLSGVAVLLGYEAVSTPAAVVGVVSLVSLAGFGIVYFWGLPAAVDDFGGERRRVS